MRDDPATHSPPEIVVSASSGGYEITVGFSIDRFWYPCRKAWAKTAWGAERKSKRLIRWYNHFVERELRSEQIEANFREDEGI
jgi:hypothetical protein